MAAQGSNPVTPQWCLAQRRGGGRGPTALRQRGGDALPVVDEELAQRLGHALGRGPRGQVDGDHVGIDMDGLHARVAEEEPGHQVRRPGAGGVLERAVALVAHAREAAVQLEAHHVGAVGVLHDDGDGLAHGGGEITCARWRAALRDQRGPAAALSRLGPWPAKWWRSRAISSTRSSWPRSWTSSWPQGPTTGSSKST